MSLSGARLQCAGSWATSILSTSRLEGHPIRFKQTFMVSVAGPKRGKKWVIYCYPTRTVTIDFLKNNLHLYIKSSFSTVASMLFNHQTFLISKFLFRILVVMDYLRFKNKKMVYSFLYEIDF